jgi:hypothetical protein
MLELWVWVWVGLENCWRLVLGISWWLWLIRQLRLWVWHEHRLRLRCSWFWFELYGWIKLIIRFCRNVLRLLR